jgi:hypothetical protein
MRKLLLYTGLFSAIVFFSCTNKKTLSPKIYFNQIIGIYYGIDSAMMSFISEVYSDSTVDVGTINNDYGQLKKYLQKQDEKLSKYKQITEDPGLLKEVKEFKDLSKEIYKVDYKKIVDIYRTDLGTKSLQDKIKDIISGIGQRLTAKEISVLELERLFAEKNYIQLPNIDSE